VKLRNVQEQIFALTGQHPTTQLLGGRCEIHFANRVYRGGTWKAAFVKFYHNYLKDKNQSK
jgi:hypothetical protein